MTSDEDVAEEGLDPITTRFASYAKENHCYVIIPLYARENSLYYNASVLLDREGANVGEHYTIYLRAGEMEKGLTPGPTDPPFFHTDFGVIGMQICFDLQFFEGTNDREKKELKSYSGDVRIADVLEEFEIDGFRAENELA